MTSSDLVINKSLTISGTGANNLIVQRSSANGTPKFRIFSISGVGVTANINGITISGGSSFTGDRSIVHAGGGILNSQSNFNLFNSAVINNTTGSRVESNTAGGHDGGGIYNDENGTVTIANSTLNNNVADQGGAIENGRGIMTIINSTISNNTSTFSGGGAVNFGFMTIANSTIVDNNSQSGYSGGIICNGTTGTNILNTIVARNNAPLNPDIDDLVCNSKGNNLIGSPNYFGNTKFINGVNGDKVGTRSNPLNPLLSPLQNNGGSTQTHALLPNSPAIDSGNNCVVNNTCAVTLPNALTTDQRDAGFPRQVDSNVDIGAFEGTQSLEITTINLPNSRIPNNIPPDIPKEQPGASIDQNFFSFTNDLRSQGTRTFTTQRTLTDEFTIYTNYFNSHGYTITATVNNPTYKMIAVRLDPTSSQGQTIRVQISQNYPNQVNISSTKFQLGCVIPPSGLNSWYYANGNANDSIGANSGILRNGANANAIGPVSHGEAFGFDGIDDYVEIPDSPSLKPQQISVEAWFKFTSLDSTNSSAPGLQYIVSKKNTRTDHFEGYSLQKYRDTNGVERLAFLISSANGNQIIANSTSPITVDQNPRNQFYHVVGTYDGSTVRLYVNGELEGIQAANFPLDYDTRPVFIGSSGEPFDGKLQGVVDEVGIYNRAITANEVRSIFESGGAGKCRGVPSNPVLDINPSSGTQQATTFTYSGSWFTPNSTIKQFLTYPNGTTQELATLTANSSGGFSAYYTSSCNDEVGSYLFKMQDVATGKESNAVPIMINESGGCFLAQTVNEITPDTVVLSTRTELIVKGNNFGQPFSASVITPEGTFNIGQGDLQYISSKEIHVWVNMGGTSAYNVTLKLNFIRDSVTRTFKVIPSTPAPIVNNITSPVTANQVATLTIDGINFQDDFKAFIITQDGTFELFSGNKQRVSSNQIKLYVVMKGSPPYNATVKIQNPDQQSATGSFQVIAQNQPPSTPLEVIGIEVTQAVQDLNNSVPLIQGKKTYVRVHVRSNTTDIANVKAQLSGTRIINGNRVALGTFNAIERTVKQQPKRISLNDSYLFELPSNPTDDWTSGIIELQFQGVSHNFNYNEADGSHDGKVQVAFQTAPKLKIKLVNVFWKKLFGQNFELSPQEISLVERDLKEMLPTANVEITRTSFKSPSALLNPLGQPSYDSYYLEHLNSALLNKRVSDGCLIEKNCDEIYLGLISPFAVSDNPPDRCSLPGITCGVVGEADAKPTEPTCNTDLKGYVASAFPFTKQIRTSLTSVHEVGHLLGRFHIDYNGKEAGHCNPPSSGIYATDGTIGGRSRNEFAAGTIYGFDGFKPYSSDSPDLMSYGSNRWISNYTYKGILDHIKNRFNALLKVSDNSDKLQLMVEKSENTLLISGNITNNQQNGELSTIYKLPSPTNVPANRTGAYQISFFDSNNQELSSYPFDPESSLESSNGNFALLLPNQSNATRISLIKNGQVLASKQASANPPLVTITFPNGGETLNTSTVNVQWTANDADGDALRYLVQYSSNAGATWETIASDLESTNYEVQLDSIGGTNQGLFRVIASDGFYSSLDQSDAFFSVNTHAPQASISNPVNNNYFVGDQNIVLSGSAFDLEDGQINDDSLLWSSDLEGSLGAGQNLSITASTLQEGTHHITLTARDSSAQTGTATITIQVFRTQPAIPATLNAAPNNLNFIAQGNANLTSAQTLAIRNDGDGTLNWSAAANQSWIQLSNTTGTAPSNIQVQVNPNGLAVGNYTGTITITSDAANSPQTINVSLTVTDPSTTSQTYEADLQGRPNGDGFVDSDDIQEIRRFVVGLDQPYQSNEFQRADCSPRSTSGDGFIDSDDVQQARRFSVGTDALQNANGPASGSIASQSNRIDLADITSTGKSSVKNNEVSSAPAFRVGSQNAVEGQTVVVPILVDAAGNEAGYTFSLEYDAAKLTDPQVAIGTAGGDVVFNKNTAGQIGFSVTSFNGDTTAAGNNLVLVNIAFTIPANAPSGAATIRFTDSLARRKTSGIDPNNPITQPTYTGGTITIGESSATGTIITGRTMIPSGRGIMNVIVILTDSRGNSRTARTTSFGYYEFKNVPTDETYTLEVKAKKYTFSQPKLIVNVEKDLTEINFTTLP